VFSKTIEFSAPNPSVLLQPVPIKRLMPDWYKKMTNYLGRKALKEDSTIKKCIPFLDTLTSGYVILNQVDFMFYKQKENILWKTNQSLPSLRKWNIGIETHGLQQVASDMVQKDEDDQPYKWLNPWRIKTPKNYSCLFTNPFNSSHSRKFRIIDGIVDTDMYDIRINFPFFLKKIEEDLPITIKKGEPIALVFPFMRDEWKMTIKKDIIDHEQHEVNLFRSIVDNYKNFVWRKKRYD